MLSATINLKRSAGVETICRKKSVDVTRLCGVHMLVDDPLKVLIVASKRQNKNLTIKQLSFALDTTRTLPHHTRRESVRDDDGHYYLISQHEVQQKQR